MDVADGKFNRSSVVVVEKEVLSLFVDALFGFNSPTETKPAFPGHVVSVLLLRP